jgi:hypothetical protein
VDRNSKYAPHPNLLLNHEGYVRYKWNKTGTTFTFKSPIMAPSHGDLSEVTLPLSDTSGETHSIKDSVRKMDKKDGSEDTDGSTSGDNDDGTNGFDSEGPPREMKSAIMGWLEDVSHPPVGSTQIASDDSE